MQIADTNISNYKFIIAKRISATQCGRTMQDTIKPPNTKSIH